MTSSDSGSDRNLVAKKGTTSYIWNFFRVKKDSEKEKDMAICRLCFKSILTRGGNTFNLTSHLWNHHPKEYAAVTKALESKKNKLTPECSDKTKQVTLPVDIG